LEIIEPTLAEGIVIQGLGVLEWCGLMGVALSQNFPSALCVGIGLDNRIWVRTMLHCNFSKFVSLLHKLLFLGEESVVIIDFWPAGSSGKSLLFWRN
jgi:hypothetical protein